MESDALLRYAVTPDAESVRVRESEAEPTKLAMLSALSDSVMASEALTKYALPESALNGAAEKAEKPNIV
jgi:hypothetical protein